MVGPVGNAGADLDGAAVAGGVLEVDDLPISDGLRQVLASAFFKEQFDLI